MQYLKLESNNIPELRNLMKLFSLAFYDTKNYEDNPPTDEYIESILKNPCNSVIVAMNEQSEVVGGLVAYELQKFEQQRSEVYLYDLAVAEDYRRQGIATNLIKELQEWAKQRGAYVIFVQADNVDAPAVALYTKLASSVEKDITHFDILV